MDLVTFTDHDTIDGCLELLSREGELPDFFISEEVSANDPRTGVRLHVSVFGIDERIHREIQLLRNDLRELLSYLERERIAAALNHIGSSLVGGQVPGRRLLEMAGAFPLLETHNGAQGGKSNQLAALVADLLDGRGDRVGRTAGSDAHTPRRIGSAWTEARAVNRSSFLEELRGRRVFPCGRPAELAPLLADVYQIVFRYYWDVASNRFGHFVPHQRRKALACALLSLPLQLVALPALGTVFRRVRVRETARRYRRQLDQAGSAGAHCAESPPLPGDRSGAASVGVSVEPVVAWMPRPGSEEA
jgi:hypothetical protein